MEKIKIAHISSVHLALDTRLFYRYCLSLKSKYEVVLIACHDKEEIRQGVRIIPFPRYKNRFFRVLFGWVIMLPKALRLKAALYHFHDPELIPVGLILKFLGKKVIYDVHENIAEDIFDKDWISHKKMWYAIYNFLEKWAIKNFKLILAEDSYQKRYKLLNADFTVIHNFCDIPFFKPFEMPAAQRNPMNLFYIGILLLNRGILEILEAMFIAKKKGYHFHFHCVAELYTQVTEAVVELPFYKHIKNDITFHGRKSLEDGYAISKKCGIGLCIIHPMKNSVESYPTKLFEYMTIGLPAISSNFDLYKSVLEKHNCGKTVDPKSAEDLAIKLMEMVDDKEGLNEMSGNGKKAVLEKYNWQKEEGLVQNVYEKLLR